jgi:Domain of unknown function (DUF4167)
MNARQHKSTASFGARSHHRESNAAREKTRGSQNAQKSYERYLALAQAESLTGNIVGAEYYYQHAEHYFRSMSSGSGTT